VLQIRRLRICNPLTYGDSGWIGLGRRTLIVGVRYGPASRGADASGGALRALSLSM